MFTTWPRPLAIIAGRSIGGTPFLEHTTAEIDRIIAVNTIALMYLTRVLNSKT
jgi:short-subunit dehydrogenase